MNRSTTKSRASASVSAGKRAALGKKCLFALVTLLLFFVVLELALALIGIEPAYKSGDPLVGFSRRIPHFVEERGADGQPVLATSPGHEALNPQRFPKNKSAGAFRIVCLGGSSTYGRPFWDETSFAGWLRVLLPAADPERGWEVINGGGISYASYRVLGVMEELATHAPDLFVIYTGHNEFLEHRTYGDLLDQPELWKDVRASAFRLRTATLLQRIAGLGKAEDDKPIVLGGEVKRIPVDAVGPEAYRRDDALREQVVNHFRISLNRMLDIAADCGAGVVLVVPASNYRDAEPFKSENTAGLDAASRAGWGSEFAKASAALNKGQHENAVGHLERCVAIDPRHAESQYLLGRALLGAGRSDAARAAFARAIEEDICPLRAVSATSAAVREVAASRGVPVIDAQSVLEARSANGITGDDLFHDHLHLSIEANRLLANEIVAVMENEGWLTPSWDDATRARVSSELLASIDRPRYAAELCKLSYAMDVFGQERMAEASLREAIALAPDEDAVLNYAVPFYSKRQRFEAAAELLEGKVDLAPEDRKALGGLADAYSRLERFADAARTFERLHALEPGDVMVLQKLAVAHSQAGDGGKAADYLRKAVELDPGSAQVQNNLGLVLAQNGDHTTAIAHYQLAIERQASLSSAHYNLGLSLVALRRVKEARAAFGRVLELQPGHRGATEQLRELESGG